MATRRQEIARKRNWVSFTISGQISQIGLILGKDEYDLKHLTSEEINKLYEIRSSMMRLLQIIAETNEGDFILKQAEK